jgi:hypothetical protein
MTTKITSANITQSGTSGISSVAWQAVQTTGFTAVAGNAYPCNTTSAAFTVTLPASPAAGNVITLTDYAGTWGTNNLTVNPNGGKINGSTSNLVFNSTRFSAQFVYVDSTQGWIIYSTANLLSTPNVDYLVVAGGGGAAAGGAGGAGGYRTGTGLSVTAGTTYTVTVGAGGPGLTIPASPQYASNGGNSSFSTITSAGGGGGGDPAQAGGSGGGGYAKAAGVITGGAGNTPSVSPSQGNNGGPNATPVPYPSGGGGGASAAGGAGSGNNSGNGGAGIQGPSFASAYGGAGPGGSPSTGYYSGGGGGGVYQAPGVAGAGGAGGGGAGNSALGNAGMANTGGGGGGGGGLTGAAGGSGIVIIAYPDKYATATATTGSPTVTTSGGYRIYAFTGNGSITF